MFPTVPEERVRKLFETNSYDVKKCIDLMLDDTALTKADTSVEIEEWSDGDATIRQRNNDAKAAKIQAKQQQNSCGSSTESDKSVENERKRKIVNGHAKEPKKKSTTNKKTNITDFYEFAALLQIPTFTV